MAKKSEHKMQIREEARRVVKGLRFDQMGHKAYREAVQKRRSDLLQKSNLEGDSAARRYKSELMYLLNNYLPGYDDRTEALIDSWRTSGDPDYDPGIRAKLRQARREFQQKSHPM